MSKKVTANEMEFTPRLFVKDIVGEFMKNGITQFEFFPHLGEYQLIQGNVQLGADGQPHHVQLAFFVQPQRRSQAPCSTTEQIVLLAAAKPHFGGKRFLFVCPNQPCAKRTTALFLPSGRPGFACRTCCGLRYTSQNKTEETPFDRKLREIYGARHSRMTFRNPIRKERKSL